VNQNEMQLVKAEPMAVQQTPNVADMLQAVIKGGVSNENVAALEKLVSLYERMQDRDAEKAFAAAFVALQSDMPQITAKTVIQNRGKYEKFEDLMLVIGPLLTRHGFTVSFSQDFKDSRILETCTLTHAGGHSRANSFAVRSGKADSDTQADCKAATTAKRNALCNALNIVIRQDILNSEHDARIEGDPNEKVTMVQADELERRVSETNSNRAAFLLRAKAKSFADIAASMYAEMDELLAKKEKAGR